MSTPKAPYYYKDGSNNYHWEPNCSKNHYPDPGWHKSNTLPPGKQDQCNECKKK